MPEPKIPKGYTILPRIILEQEIWKMSPLHFKVYTYLVNKASHVTNDKYERGVCLVTISELQDTCSYNVGYRKERPTKHQIDNVLRWLRKTYEATDENGTKATMITSTKTTAKTTNTGHYIQEHKELKQELKDYMSDSKSNDRHIESEFNEWYELYNKKKDRKAAFTKFKTARKKHEFDVIMNGTTEYLKTITDKQFQKYPKTFLHNESFLDDYSDVVTTDNTEMQYYDELLGDG